MALMTKERALALSRIQDWRNDSAQALFCPRCGGKGLEIKDQSVRPYREWYQLVCFSCSLNETVSIPLSSSGSNGIN